MKILIVTHYLDNFAGSELFTKDLAINLNKRGHEVSVFSPVLGGVSDVIKASGIKVVDDIKHFQQKKFDIIHAQHNTTAILVRSVFPNIPMIFMSHGVLPELEQVPSVALGINRFIAISEGVKKNLVKNNYVPFSQIDIVRNFIDFDRFYSQYEPNEKLKKILVLSNHYREDIKKVIETACEELNIEVKHAGRPDNPVDDVENWINQSDLVVTLGRGALEAMACGRNVLVYDINGADGMITKENFYKLRENSFSGRTYRKKLTINSFKKELLKYDKSRGKKLGELVAKEHSPEKIVADFEDIYRKVISGSSKDNRSGVKKGALFNEINFLENKLSSLYREEKKMRSEAEKLSDMLDKSKKELTETRKKKEKLNELFEKERLWSLELEKLFKKEQSNCAKLKKELEIKQQEVDFVKNSKFWKAREDYLKCKYFLLNPRRRLQKYARYYCSESVRIGNKYKGLAKKFLQKKDLKKEALFLKRSLAKDKLPKLESKPKASLIVLNRNGRNHLIRFFDSIKKNTPYFNFEVIIIDNASTDDSNNIIESYKKSLNIRLIKNKENVSFSYGCNQGSEVAQGELLIFMNNDLELFYGWLTRMVNCWQENVNQIGAVGARLIYPKEKGSICSYSVQHAGIKFLYDKELDFFRPFNYGYGDKVSKYNEDKEFLALTAAMLLIPKDVFREARGFDENYNYGYEDVDLCLKIYKMGYKNIVCSAACAFHYEGASQDKDKKAQLTQRRLNNVKIFKTKWHSFLKNEIYKNSFLGNDCFSAQAFKVAIVVTEAGKNAKAGDYFTGMELGATLNNLFGWEVVYLERRKGNWYEVGADVKLIISLLDCYDIKNINTKSSKIIKVAWARNWFERWVEHKYIKKFDVILASSLTAKNFMEKKLNRKIYLFPIATNHERFKNSFENKSSKEKRDLVFTGNYWGSARDIMNIFSQDNFPYSLCIYGNGWSEVDALKKYHKGYAHYSELPVIYSNSKIVIDDAVSGITKPWGSVNSRVFDALNAGALVLTSGKLGASETFAGELPSFESKEDFLSKVDYYLKNDKERKNRARDLKNIVVQNHTYRLRALQLWNILRKKQGIKPKIAIKIGVPSWQEAKQWGDYHFAKALKKCFEKKGWNCLMQVLPEWNEDGLDKDCSAVLVLRGLSQYKTKKNHFNIMWNISHPGNIKQEEYDQYDHVFIASSKWADEIKKHVNVPIEVLEQCTDPELFSPPNKNEKEAFKSGVLFVGNSRKQFRNSVKYAINAKEDVKVYGNLWEDIISSEYIAGEYIPNEKLCQYYSSARVVLNDHWQDMKEKGFLSNRVYDALASEAVILTDKVKDMNKEIKDCVFCYENEKDFKRKLDYIRKNPQKAKNSAKRGRELVLSNHTYKHRVDRIIEAMRNKLICD
jgi:GT2 family glycosyltransferase/spore maturation protein CgeB